MNKALNILNLTIAILLIAGVAIASNPDDAEAYRKRVEVQQQQQYDFGHKPETIKTDSERSQNREREIIVIQEMKNGEVNNKQNSDDNKFIFRKNENLVLIFSGRLHRMFLGVDDGANSDLYFTDSEQGPTMLRFDATGKVNDAFTIMGTIETGIRQNPPSLVSQDNREAGTSVRVRIAEVVLDWTRFGKLSLGRGFAAAWLTPEIDLSGTQFANLLSVGMLAPGMKFVNASNDSLSNIQVLTYFVDLERLLLIDRFRYDSRVFGPGLQLSGSVANDGRWDLSLRAKPQSFGNWKLVAGGSYQHKPFTGIDRRWDAAVSVLHNPTGLNLTVGGSIEEITSGRNANGWIIKAGWLADIISLGKTAFTINYYKSNDLRLNSDKAESVGAFAVQKWPDYGVDFYAGYRNYDITRPDINLKALDILVMGVVLNF